NKKDRIYFNDFDVADFEPPITGEVYYVDPINGSDTNNGTSIKPLKSGREAIRKGDADVIWVASGVFTRTELPANLPDRNVSIKALPGAQVTFSCHDDLSWSLTENMTNTYQADRSSVDWVWDSKQKDPYGDNIQLTSLESISEVEVNPGSYYIDGSTVYVHTHDSRSLINDTDIRAYIGTFNLIYEGGSTIYLEN